MPQDPTRPKWELRYDTTHNSGEFLIYEDRDRVVFLNEDSIILDAKEVTTLRDKLNEFLTRNAV